MLDPAQIVRDGLAGPPFRLPLAGTCITAEKCGWQPLPDVPHRRPAFREADRRPADSPAARLDAELDREACRIASLHARCRLIFARLAAELLKRCLWRPLGFCRLTDYSRERLGVSARSLEDDARVATAMASLPRIECAYMYGTILWTHARLLTGVATPETENEWLQVALTSTTRGLAEAVRGLRVGSTPGDTAGKQASKDAGDSTSAASDDSAAGRPNACASADDEPLVMWSIDVPREDRKLWRATMELAARMCGSDVPSWRVAEAVAAEAMSWSAWEPATPAPPSHRPAGDLSEAFVLAFQAAYGTAEGYSWLEPALRPPAEIPELDALLTDLPTAEADELDARLRKVCAMSQQVDAQLGAVLRRIADRCTHRALGFANLTLYAEARLGMCGAKAKGLVRLDRECSRKAEALLEAYRDGRVSWLASTAILPVISRRHADAWIERAESVTLRRLKADVSWALDRTDDKNGHPFQPPPSLDLDVIADALGRIDMGEVQMRACPDMDRDALARRVGARIRISMPQSVADLLEDAIEGCRKGYEPRWRGFQRVLAHAFVTWTSLPQREGSIYARDNFRCQVPGCSRRGVLHVHHVWYRSQGGPDDAWNLITVCHEHHRAFIHLGFLRVEGSAPDGLVWELGCRPGKPPLMRLRGDVYIDR